MSSDSSQTVISAETTFRIIEKLKYKDGMRLTPLAKELDMAKSTVHRYLQTMIDNGYLIKEDNIYYLSFRFLEYGEYTRNRKQAYTLAKNRVSNIADQTGERAIFFVEEHSEAVYVHRVTGEMAVQSDEGIGSRIELHMTAGGKAILAEWSDDRIEAYAEQCDFEQRTPHTIADEQKLYEEINHIRDRGYAMNSEEAITELRAIGASICAPEDRVIGSISISGPLHRMKGQRIEEDLPDLLLGVTNELELNLRYP
jgi:DNA-binding IclR family transcriptional regulator